ncbi:ATP-dependent nuclease [Gracilimonas sp.]|uniref:ATP-dependent nuclease n=1 Tax=Gracilimonas sp. TaxID=1974203 RepID=UPI003D0D101C
MHTLSHVKIENYKSIKSLELNLTGYTPIVGYNNAGKSNILEAIDWFLSNSYGMDESAFRSLDYPPTVTGRIKGVTEELLDELDDRHKRQIEDYVVDGIIIFRFRQLKPSGRAGDRELMVRDPEVEDDEAEEAFTDNPAGISNALTKLFPKSIFIRAMEDATEDVSSNKRSTTIGKLISEITDPVKEEHKNDIEEAIGKLNNLFTADGEERVESFKEFDTIADNNIADFFPGISLKLHVPPPTIDDIFKQGTVKFSERGDDLREFSLLGHGAQRSIQMGLVKMLSEYGVNEEGLSRKFLLIEEPELFLHPKGILVLRNALRKLAKSGYQVLFATHSPLVITKDDIADTILIRKSTEEGTYRLNSLRESVARVIDEHDKQADVLFELTNSTKLLFADKAVLVEGKTENDFLPSLYQIISEKEDNEKSIAFIPLNGSGGMIKSAEILQEMGIPQSMIVDLDFCFQIAWNTLLEEDDEDILAFIELVREYQDEGGYGIAENGLPKKNNGVKASDAYSLIATKGDAEPLINNLKDKMLALNYWVWSKGDVENMLGIEVKNEYRAKLMEIANSQDWEGVIDESDKVKELFEWVNDL